MSYGLYIGKNLTADGIAYCVLDRPIYGPVTFDRATGRALPSQVVGSVPQRTMCPDSRDWTGLSYRFDMRKSNQQLLPPQR